MLESAPERIPPLLQQPDGEQRTHVFFIHSPIALVMSLMIADAYKLAWDKTIAVSQRGMKTQLSGFEPVSMVPKRFDRYVNRISGRNLAAMRVGRLLKARGQRFIVYASWYYSEIEEITRSKLCDGVVVFEDGQLSYHPAVSYKDTLLNTWRFRKRRLPSGTTDYWFRQDASAFISLTPEAFPRMPSERRFVLKNLSAAAQNYSPLLEGVNSIGLMPAPRRLPGDAVYAAMKRLIEAIPGRGVIRLHPGYKFETYYSTERFSEFISGKSGGRVSLCPEDAVIELEMAKESKVLFGAQTSLSRYASLFGSTFVDVTFDRYIKPVI